MSRLSGLKDTLKTDGKGSDEPSKASAIASRGFIDRDINILICEADNSIIL